MAYRDKWEVAQEMCSTGRGERPWHECVSSALVRQRGGCTVQTCLEASAGEQKDNMVKEGNGASVSGEKICLQD